MTNLEIKIQIERADVCVRACVVSLGLILKGSVSIPGGQEFRCCCADTPPNINTVQQTVKKSLLRILLEWEIFQLLKGDEEDDVPRPQSQPVWPESLIERKETFVLPRLHHSVQCSLVHRASGQNALVHHAGPDHIYRVGGQRPRKATRKT